MLGLRESVVLGLVVLAASARANVPCNDPDNFCTGDPCVIHDVEVTTPCTLDFGVRMVVMNRVIEIMATGNLTASGHYSLGPGGCIAASCGATCDTSGASFNPPPVADCPGDCP